MMGIDNEFYTRSMKTLVIIPAFNEAENIDEVVTNLRDNYPQYDFIIINDGSLDDTAEIYPDMAVCRCYHGDYGVFPAPADLVYSCTGDREQYERTVHIGHCVLYHGIDDAHFNSESNIHENAYYDPGGCDA